MQAFISFCGTVFKFPLSIHVDRSYCAMYEKYHKTHDSHKSFFVLFLEFVLQPKQLGRGPNSIL